MSNQKNKGKVTNYSELPPIPEKLYFTIGEVGQLCKLKPHVLRYWEQEFPQLSPSKRRGNRRYYQRKDVLLIRKIKQLLYQEGFTIEGARQKLANNSDKTTDQKSREMIQKTVAGLEEILEDL